MANRDYEEIYQRFVRWSAMDRATKIKLGLPTVQDSRAGDGFCQRYEVGARTLRKWKNRPEFEGDVEAARAKLAGEPIVDTSLDEDRVAPSLEDRAAAIDAGLSEDEAEYRSIKEAIALEAKQGDNAKALELYMKHWGHEFAAAERDAREGLFRSLDDDELVAEILNLIGPDEVRSWLEKVDA